MNAEQQLNKWIAMFDMFISKYNPCQWTKGKCAAHRQMHDITHPYKKSKKACCRECNHCSRTGCTIENVACKSFLCKYALANLSDMALAEYKIIGKYAFSDLPGLSSFFYKTKEEQLDHMRKFTFDEELWNDISNTRKSLRLKQQLLNNGNHNYHAH